MTKPNLIQDTWEIVQHNWHETSINAQQNQQRICKLDTEDWDVDEDNQYELESVQLQVARLIVAAPSMLKFLKNLQTNVASGQVSVDEATNKHLQQIIQQATKEQM